MKKICYAIVGLVFSVSLEAQESNIPIIKAEVQETQIMFKKTIWRRMDLNEKQNKAFNSRNNELSRLLLTAVEEGLIKPYMTDSCLNLMPDDIFKSNTTVEIQGGGGGGFDGGFGGGFGSSTAPAASGPQVDAIPKEIFSILYFKEELIFDRNRSRMYWYIRTVSVALPGSAGPAWNPAGFEKLVAHFKYEDVVNLVRGPYADRAIWYNTQNQAQHRNIGDALELRLFKAPITKVSNAENLDIRQIVSDPFEAILLQEKYEYDLMEFESELWEY
jgi:gliding motility associated protien GldN